MVQIKTPPVYDTLHWKIIPDFALVNPPPILVLTKATEGAKIEVIIWHNHGSNRDTNPGGANDRLIHFSGRKISNNDIVGT